MAVDKNGNYIKGTKKELPESWVTYGFRYAIMPKDNQKPRLESSFGCERKVFNEYVADFYKWLEKSDFEDGNIIYSKNYQKTVERYQKTMTKAKNQRHDFLHKLSNQITNDYDATVVEDLALNDLAQCLSLGKKLHDNGFGMFRNMLQYKSKKKGKHYIVADKYFPSSKLCSHCGHKKDELKLSTRVYECENCQVNIDRDHNAGRNGIQVLREYGFLKEPTTV